MGNQMSDKRTARRENAPSFAAAVDRIRAELTDLPPPPPAAGDGCGAAARNVSVCVRKRPMLPHEQTAVNYDIVTCLDGSRIVVHECRMHADMKRMFVDNHDMSFDRVFGEGEASSVVYAESAAGLVAHALSGGTATVLMYGQTGTGKTYTMTAIQELSARDLFATAGGLTVTAIEVAGGKVLDLFGERAERTVLQAGNGRVHVRDAVEVEVASPEALMDCLRVATEARATCGTERNDTSSRSHAIYQLQLGAAAGGGRLLLVDLAGSERNIDSQNHDAQRRKEGAEINRSLMTLKDCVRTRARNAARGTNDRVPYRDSKLTQLLRHCFTSRDSRMLVLATVSPLPQDTEHTLNTLRHSGLMEQRELDVRKTTVPVAPVDDADFVESKHPDEESKAAAAAAAGVVRRPRLETPMAQWDAERVREWGRTVLNGRFAACVDDWPSAFSGRDMKRTSEGRWKQLAGGDTEGGKALLAAARAELRRQDQLKRERASANRENIRNRASRRSSC